MLGKISYLLAGLLVLNACGFAEDPLANKDERIKQARPPGDFSKPQAEDGEVKIDVENTYSFKEGRAQSINIRLRPLKPGFENNTEVVVDNLGDFPGAVFDPQDNIFKWTPPEGSVSGGGNGEFVLRIQGFARHEKDPNRFIVGHKNVIIYVNNDPKAPTIVSMKMLTSGDLREGDSRTIEIVVEDTEAGTAENQWPELLFFRPQGNLIPLGHLMNQNNVVPNFTKKLWTFTYTLDLRNQDLVTSSGTGGFGVAALNMVGRKSNQHNFSSRVLNKLNMPVANWIDDTLIHFDQENTITFEITDMKKEAVLQMTVKTSPLGSDLQCRMVTYGHSICQFKWKPTGNANNYPLRGQLEIEVVARNQNSSDPHEVRKTFRLGYKMSFPAGSGERGEP